MAQDNATVVRSFVNGATNGQANRMDIREGPLSYAGTEYVHEGETALIGYGWAIYAKRTGTGRIVVFNGWRDWAKDKPGHSGSTTLHHLKLIENAAGPTFIYKDAQAQCASPPKTAKTMRPQRA